MLKPTRLPTISALLTSLLALSACRDSREYNGPLALDGRANSVTLSPATFHLEEGEAISLQVRTTDDLVVPTSLIRWSVEPSSAAEVKDDGTLVARTQTGTVRVNATVGRSSATSTGSISAIPARLERANTYFSTGVVGLPLSDSLAVLVLSTTGRKVEGASVAFEVVSGGGRSPTRRG